ncbi:MAG: hypothetical protein LBG19_00095 [Prevotellaceae bacterium]|jgi:hypothetical protein|nr:hypothetical protein [Prevotellaceae bacterium]
MDQVLTLNDPAEVMVITIKDRHFIYSGKGTEFMELLVSGSSALGVVRSVKTIPMGKEGAFGTINNTGTIYIISNMDDNPHYQFSDEEFVNVKIENGYYLLDDKDNITAVKGIKSFEKACPKEKLSAIKKYADENKISLKKEEDIIKLTEYCNQQ